MGKTQADRQADVGSRRAIVNLLKQHGPQDAARLSEMLGVSAMGVRQHLYDLQEQGFITFEEEPRPKGRPVKLWQLTRDADRFFADAHVELAVGLIDAVGHAFGADGMEKLLAIRTRQQISAYARQLPKGASLRRRVQALAKIRSKEGYMAEARSQKDGSLLLVENHCPICEAATNCTWLCSSEMELFQSVLGPDAEIERTEHILSGARRCVYRIRNRET